MNRWTPKTLALVGLVVCACNSDRAAAPPDTVLTDRQVSRDIAVSEGDAAANELASISSYSNLAGVNFSVATDASRGEGMKPNSDIAFSVSSACTYAAGRWSCAPVTENGLTVVRSYAFYDAAGQPMKVKDDLTTASINFISSVNGTVSRDSTFSGVVHRNSNATVSGLLGKETTRRWDSYGFSADTNTHRSTSSTRTYAGTSADTVKAVVYPQPRTATSYPLSGTMVRATKYRVTSTGRSTEQRSVERRVVITYNGTAEARLESGGTVCTLHLDTHRVDGCTG